MPDIFNLLCHLFPNTGRVLPHCSTFPIFASQFLIVVFQHLSFITLSYKFSRGTNFPVALGTSLLFRLRRKKTFLCQIWEPASQALYWPQSEDQSKSTLPCASKQRTSGNPRGKFRELRCFSYDISEERTSGLTPYVGFAHMDLFQIIIHFSTSNAPLKIDR